MQVNNIFESAAQIWPCDLNEGIKRAKATTLYFNLEEYTSVDLQDQTRVFHPHWTSQKADES